MLADLRLLKVRGLVVATGAATGTGCIGTLLAAVEALLTPLPARMDHLARWLLLLNLVASGLLLAWGTVMAVVGIAVAAIPECLPAVMTISLVIGVQAMAPPQLYRPPPASNRSDQVCPDHLPTRRVTLTGNEMLRSAEQAPSGSVVVAGEGYAPLRAPLPGIFISWRAQPRCAVTRACTAAKAFGRSRAIRWKARCWPLPARWTEDLDARQLDAIPFDNHHRFMAVLTERRHSRLSYVMAALDCVLPMCTGLDQNQWHARAKTGARINAAALEGGLIFLGRGGLIDPPRSEAVAAAAKCRLNWRSLTACRPGRTLIGCNKQLGQEVM